MCAWRNKYNPGKRAWMRVKGFWNWMPSRSRLQNSSSTHLIWFNSIFGLFSTFLHTKLHSHIVHQEDPESYCKIVESLYIYMAAEHTDRVYNKNRNMGKSVIDYIMERRDREGKLFFFWLNLSILHVQSWRLISWDIKFYLRGWHLSTKKKDIWWRLY